MGLFNSIKKTASNAVNAVTGNQATPQQPVQPQPVQPVQSQQPVQPVQSQQNPSQPANRELSFMGKTYRNPTGGPFAKGTRFFEDHIQYGNNNYSYAELSEITITHMPTTFAAGSAEALHKPTNSVLNITFVNDAPGFVKGVDYANEKISEANGGNAGRKFLLRNPDGSKAEVYEDYISLKTVGKGISALMGTNDSTLIIMIQDISSIAAINGTQLIINYSDEGSPLQCAISFAPTDINVVNEIVSYVQNFTPDVSEETEEETWVLVTGSVKEFSLLGRSLIVNENWDVFNSYRTMYMKCAALYTEKMKKKYLKKINNFDSFMRFYLPLYKEYLDKIISKTTDILVSAGIWTETSESIMQRHVENNHLAMDDYTTMYDSLLATVQNNKAGMAALTSFVPNLVGGGFGLKGAAVGIAQATAFNLLRDGAESALIDNMNISAAQKAELYGRINQEVLFDRAFADMWRVFFTLIDIMNENGKNIWRPTDEDSAKADNIMKNVSNPNFPQAQFPDVMIQVIGMDPYKRSIYELLRSRGADEGEVKTISEFFGYTDTTPDCVG
ncbi:MAG: hypothetical protein IKH82_05305 [Clostridiales bacterium]|nr:hypothetical protein [Clostridiales bacterium]